ATGRRDGTSAVGSAAAYEWAEAAEAPGAEGARGRAGAGAGGGAGAPEPRVGSNDPLVGPARLGADVHVAPRGRQHFYRHRGRRDRPVCAGTAAASERRLNR